MSKTNIQSFHKSDSQGWLLQACHGTVNLALDSWTHSFFPCLVCARRYAGDTTHSYCPALHTLVGRNRHINRVMMQKLHTVTNLPGDRFCWSQSNLNIYLTYQNFLHGYIFFLTWKCRLLAFLEELENLTRPIPMNNWTAEWSWTAFVRQRICWFFSLSFSYSHWPTPFLKLHEYYSFS